VPGRTNRWAAARHRSAASTPSSVGSPCMSYAIRTRPDLVEPTGCGSSMRSGCICWRERGRPCPILAWSGASGAAADTYGDGGSGAGRRLASGFSTHETLWSGKTSNAVAPSGLTTATWTTVGTPTSPTQTIPPARSRRRGRSRGPLRCRIRPHRCSGEMGACQRPVTVVRRDTCRGAR
jgi:hypothetical protein